MTVGLVFITTLPEKSNLSPPLHSTLLIFHSLPFSVLYIEVFFPTSFSFVCVSISSHRSNMASIFSLVAKPQSSSASLPPFASPLLARRKSLCLLFLHLCCLVEMFPFTVSFSATIKRIKASEWEVCWKNTQTYMIILRRGICTSRTETEQFVVFKALRSLRASVFLHLLAVELDWQAAGEITAL